MMKPSLKIAKYFAIALLVVAIMASTSWVLRNAIIQRISGPILANYGMAVTDVSLDALATDNAAISYLELEHESGASIAIEELILPIGASSSGTKKYSADTVSINFPTEGDAKPLGLAEIIDQILTLRDTLSGTEVVVNELNTSNYPDVQEVRWSLTEEQQIFAANVDAVSLRAQIVAKDENLFEARVSLQQTSLKVPEQSFTTAIEQTERGIRLSGAFMIELPIIGTIARSIAASMDSTLAGIEFANGAAIIEHNADIPYDLNAPASATVYVKPSAPFELAYSVEGDVINVVRVRSASPIKLEVTYPQTQWSISEEMVSLSMSYEEWDDITASIADLTCTNGPSCSLNMDVSMNNSDLTVATASRLQFTASPDVAFREDGIQVQIRPDAELSLTGMSVSDTDLARVNAVLMSDATLELADSGWQFDAEALDADVKSLSLDDNIKFSAPISLRKLSIGDSDQLTSINVEVNASSCELTWDERALAFPGFSGSVSLNDVNVTADLTTIGLHNDAAIRAKHNLDAEKGRARIQGATLLFDVHKLSDRISPWTEDWDIAAGTVSSDAQINWQNSDSGWQLAGRYSLSAIDLAGAYADTAFAGLSTSIDANFDTATGIIVEPAQIEIDLVEIGLPIENITADYTLYPHALSIDVENLRMQAFGGIVGADPFTYELESERNDLLLRAESIELTELLTLKEFEAIELSGSIGAELPVVIEGDEVSILKGTLTGEDPGGVIRYQPEIVPDSTGSSAIGIVTEALSNFEYDTLTSTVAYSKDGDLMLQMQIAGRNPDLPDNRPVVLNLGVENNVPQMLRSLQAARAVEEILEKRIER